MAKTQTYRARESGITLLEVLITLAIMGLALVATAPLVTGSRAGFEVKAAGSVFLSAAREARELAIRLNRPVSLRLDLERKQLSINNGEPVKLGSQELEISFTTARSLTLSDDTGAVVFFPDGSSTGGAVTLGRGAIRRSYAINWMTGQVRQIGDDLAGGG